MDIAFCSVHKQKRILHYAGANRPLIIIRNGEMQEYAPSKFAIGGQFNADKKFAANKIQLEKGDRIYLSTDGFADQFGGPKGKKLMKKNFYKLLITPHSPPMHEQKEKPLHSMEEWRGELSRMIYSMRIAF